MLEFPNLAGEVSEAPISVDEGGVANTSSVKSIVRKYGISKINGKQTRVLKSQPPFSHPGLNRRIKIVSH